MKRLRAGPPTCRTNCAPIRAGAVSASDLSENAEEGAYCYIEVGDTGCGEEAVATFERHADELKLVLVDLAMPRMGGDEAFKKIRHIRRDASVIISSGYDEQEATKTLVGHGLAGFIQKPYSLASLAAQIRQALDRVGRFYRTGGSSPGGCAGLPTAGVASGRCRSHHCRAWA